MPSQFPESTLTGPVTVSGTEIINSAGKIPALSSTYLASLDGSALTGISAGAVTAYTATTASCSNTTSKIAVVTVGQIAANDWDDGDFLVTRLAAQNRNYSGSTRTVTWEVSVQGNTQSGIKNWENNTNIGYGFWDIQLMRAGSEIYWGFGNEWATRSGMNPADGSQLRITSVDFTAAIDVLVNITMPVANATLYCIPQSANSYMVKRTT